jgi:hypothetical protein
MLVEVGVKILGRSRMNFPVRTKPIRRSVTNRFTILGVTPRRSAAASIVKGV